MAAIPDQRITHPMHQSDGVGVDCTAKEKVGQVDQAVGGIVPVTEQIREYGEHERGAEEGDLSHGLGDGLERIAGLSS